MESASSVALVTSDEGLAFGTAFLIAVGGQRFMLTCGHVVRDVGCTSVRVGGMPADVLAIGSPDGSDLALLKMHSEWPGAALNLGGSSPAEGLFTTVGFQTYSDRYVLRTLSGTFGRKSLLLGRAGESRMATVELAFGGDIRIQAGFSGAPIIEVASGKVVGVLSHSENQGRRAMAVDIEGLDLYTVDELADFVRLGTRPQLATRAASPAADAAPLIIEREHELAILEKVHATARAGAGRVVFVLGQAGMGKSTLVSSFLASRTDRLDVTLQAQASPLIGSRLAYGLFKDLAESLLAPRPDSDQPSPLDLAAQTLHNLGVRRIGAGMSFAGSSTSRLAARLRDLTDPADRDNWTAADLTQEGVFEYYSKTFEAISHHYSLVISLEDIHWADDSSLLLLAHMAKTITRHPILLISSMRSETAQQNPLAGQVCRELRASGAAVIDLDKPPSGLLTWAEDFCRQYLLREYGTYFSDSFLHQLIELSRGNPFFLVESLNLLNERNAIRFLPDGRYHLENTQAVLAGIPDRVGSLIESRLGYLDPSTLAVLKSASVEGAEFTGEICAPINNIDIGRFMRDIIPRLENTHQLVVDGRRLQPPSGDVLHTYNFSHHLIQRYIYDTLLGKHERQDFHLEVARLTERFWGSDTGEYAGEIALHYALADQRREAFRFATLAVRHYLPQLAWSEVVRYSRLGLESLQTLHGLPRSPVSTTESMDEEISLRIAYATAERNGGIVTELIDHIAAGLEVLAPSLTAVADRIDQLAGEVYLAAGSLHAVLNVHDEYYGNTYLERAADIFTLTGDREKLTEALSLSCYDTNLPSQAAAESQLAIRRQVLALTDQIGRPPLRAKALLDLALHYLNFDSTEEEPLVLAETAAREALELVRGRNNSAELNALLILSWIIHHSGRYGPELEQHRWDLYRRARALGQSVLEVDALTDLGHYYAQLVSSPDQADSMMRDALSARRRLGHHAVHDLENLSVFLFRRGSFPEAQSLLQMMVETALGSRFQRASAMIAWMQALTGDRPEAWRLLAEAPPPSRPGSDLTIWAMADLELGNLDRAVELARQISDSATMSARRGLFHIYRDDATVLADIYQRVGDLAQTARWLEIARSNWQRLDTVTNCRELIAYWEHLFVVAKCQLALGNIVDGGRSLADAAGVFDQWGHYLAADANCRLAELMEQTDAPGARTLMTRVVDRASQLGLHNVIIRAESWLKDRE